MVHRYQLHKPVVVRCACCGRNVEFTFTSASDQVVCSHCAGHIGDTPSIQMRREREHVQWWQECEAYWHSEHAAEVERLTTQHKAEVTRLQDAVTESKTLVAGLRATVKDEFKLHNPVVATWLDEEALNEEREKTTKARNYIGHLHRALWHVDIEHHIPEDADEDEDVCRCGVLASECATFKALDPVRSRLYQWERENVERARNYQPNELPRDHPEMRRFEPPAHGSTA